MKTIGIIGAMEEEIAGLKEKAEIVATRNVIGQDFFLGRLFGKNVVLVRSGIGKVNAAICAQVLIDLFAVDYIINVGVAGAIHTDLTIGDVVVSSDAVQHDMDASVFGDPVGVIPRMPESFFAADEELIKIAEEVGHSLPEQPKIIIGRVASGDQFISDGDRKKKIWKDVQGFCAEMEGAAIAHTCYLNKIPFVIIRSISDAADESANVSFAEFVKKAAKISSQLVTGMVERL